MMAGMNRSVWWCVMTAAVLAGTAAAQTAGGASGPWVIEQSGTRAGLRGIHAVSADVAWASGTGGTILRTVDGGATWARCAVPPDAEKLDFRGIWAWDAKTAIAMSSGPGDQSRLYKTVDGCKTWKLLLKNSYKQGFWDGIVFFGQDAATSSGWMVGDPVDHEFQLWHTENGGRRWLLEHHRAPRAEPESQGAFAASNSSLILAPNVLGIPSSPAIGSGGTGGGFFYESSSLTICVDECTEAIIPARASDWTTARIPLGSGNASSGVFSLAFRDVKTAIAVGGDYTRPDESTGTAAWSADGGKTWTAAAKMPHGFRSTVAWDPNAKAWIAAGTNGSDISYDDGKTWVPLEDGNWNALSLPWVVGPDGRIAKLNPNRLKP